MVNITVSKTEDRGLIPCMPAKEKDQREVTLWYRWDHQTEKFVFNHVTEGFDVMVHAPVPVNASQTKGWKGATWKSQQAIKEGSVIRKTDSP